MLRAILGARVVLAMAVAACIGVWGLQRYPVQRDDPFLALIQLERPLVYDVLTYGYTTVWFTTPFLAASLLTSVLTIVAYRYPYATRARALPPYPHPEARPTPMLVLGETHLGRMPGPGPAPTWLEIPQRGLYTGVLILGAVGSGKTSACMYPYVQQLLRWRAHDAAHKLGGLVLEVKGDFCSQVRHILAEVGREQDYLEIGLDTGVCYNPLHNDLDPYAVAYAIGSLLNNLFGKSKEPFWQQAYTDLPQFVISLRRITEGYTTLLDVSRLLLEGIVVFLSLFDENPAVHRAFCPSRDVYIRPPKPGEPRPLPTLEDLLETGHVLGLNFPVAMNPALARGLAVMLKLDFQRAVLQRIPKMGARPEGPWRDLLFVADEYHAFATVGETDPTGDERAFALSRQARLMPIVATQSVSSLRSALGSDEGWRTLLQCFRTKIFLATSDEFTARIAADLCGKADRLKARYSLTEAGQGAHISLLTGSATAARHSLSASKTYMLESDYVFQPRVFTELQHAQAIALPYDGLNPLPAQYCYLKPHYLDVQTSYFEHLARGAL